MRQKTKVNKQSASILHEKPENMQHPKIGTFLLICIHMCIRISLLVTDAHDAKGRNDTDVSSTQKC